MIHAPVAVVEPGPRIRRAVGLEAKEIADRTLEADRRRMQRADRGKMPVAAFEAEHARCRPHRRAAPCAPRPGRPTGRAGSSARREARPRQDAKRPDRPRRAARDDAPRPVAPFAISSPKVAIASSREDLRHAGTRSRAAAAGRCRRRRPAPDARTAARRKPEPARCRRAVRRRQGH